jgi:hypothetical protein
MPITASTCDTITVGSLRLKIATASAQPASISIQSSNEPS